MPPLPDAPLLLAATLTGGLGLFLLGVSLLTDGLKLAAGRALERILAAWTRTPLHGLVTGVLLTALLQSSTAMTVAAIGFVNAGLLRFAPALWVVFGSNLGSSFTGWLVAWLGFGIQVDAFALPFIGLGMALRLTGGGTLRAAVGTTLAGFGVMFTGIELLKEAFAGLGPEALPHLGEGAAGVARAVGLGLVLTVVLQASSATLALVLTAVAGGMLPLEAGAAVVIGANVGTTLTGILAAIGATGGARRLAAAHVLFNVVTAVVAVLLLGPLLKAVGAVTLWVAGSDDAVTRLVAFHTAFNALGVLLMWPLSGPLARFLLRRFRGAEEDLSHPRYLDRNVAAVPELALQALRREMARLGHLALDLAVGAAQLAPARLPWTPAPAQADQQLGRQMQAVEELQEHIGRFVADLSRAALPNEVARQLPELLRIAAYFDTLARVMHHVGRQAVHLARVAAPSPLGLPWAVLGPAHDDSAVAQTQARHAALLGEVSPVVAAAQALFRSADPEQAAAAAHVEETHALFEEDYQTAKARLLQAGALGQLDVKEVYDWLALLSDLHRAADQCRKAVRGLAALSSPPGPAGPPPHAGDA